MGCENCSNGKGGKPAGCRGNGGCSTGGCNKMNTFDWLVDLPLPEQDRFGVHEISFKNGLRKAFYSNDNKLDVLTGDMVAVESDGGFDVGRITLSGQLADLQLKRRKVNIKKYPLKKMLRKAHEHDLEKVMDVRSKEKNIMIRAREITKGLKIEMKVGEVELRPDSRKAIFYYTADGRIDFRELIKQYALSLIHI